MYHTTVARTKQHLAGRDSRQKWDASILFSRIAYNLLEKITASTHGTTAINGAQARRIAITGR